MTQLPTDLSHLTPEQRQQLEEKLKNMSPEELAELQKQQCIFCQIISGKIPSKKIYEDNLCLAVLDINPAAKGHVLLLTKEHYAIMPQVPENVLSQLFLVSKQLSHILLKVLKVDGVNVFVANGPAAGQRAQHFMIHLIPRKTGDKILDLEENLIDKEMISKVKSAVEGKLNDLLKGKGLALPAPKEPATPSPDHPPLDEVVKGDKEKKVEKKETKEKSKKEKKTVKKPKKKKESKKKPQKTDEEASLDDIAKLFG